MKGAAAEGKRWLKQAEIDLQVAKPDLGGGFFAAACFNAHQAAEKALKAWLYARAERPVLGHSVAELCQRCQQSAPELLPLRASGHKLDRFYLVSRYPDALPGGIPGEAFHREEAEESIGIAEAFLSRVRNLLGAA